MARQVATVALTVTFLVLTLLLVFLRSLRDHLLTAESFEIPLQSETSPLKKSARKRLSLI